jgi:Ca2+-binding EF-hand superfamily protein
VKKLALALAPLLLAACSHHSPATAIVTPSQSVAPAPSACNATLDRPVAKTFDDYDVDHDGSVSYDEYFCSALRKFNALDVDKDEFLEKSETKALGKWKNPADQNNDGKLSVVEYLWAAEQAFKRADKNGDHRLSRAEFPKELP